MLLFIAVCISNTQESNILESYIKPINSTIPVVCPGCNDSACLIYVNNVTVDEDDYILDNRSLILSANDPNIYGTIECGGNTKQLKRYLVCPPVNGK